MGATDDVASAPTHEVGPSIPHAREDGLLERWSARSHALARSPAASRELREALARERVRARLGSLGVAPPPLYPDEAARARELALDVSARSAVRVLLEDGALRSVRRPRVLARTWTLAEAHDPVRPAPPSVGVLATPTWEGTRAGLHAELTARARGATLAVSMDPSGAWRAGVRLSLPRDALLYGQVRPGEVRLEVRATLGPGLWLRAGFATDTRADAWSGALTLDVR